MNQSYGLSYDETLFLSNQKVLKVKIALDARSLAVGSPLGSPLANIFMCSFESKWLWDYPNDFKPMFSRRYMDDTFTLFFSSDHADKFKDYFSSKQPNINFSKEKERNGCLSSLDDDIFREKKRFATNVYKKWPSVGVYTNFKSFVPQTYEIGLIKSLLFQCFSLSSDFIKFHHEIDKLNSILYKNSYPRDLADKCIKKILNKTLAPKNYSKHST